METVPPPLTQLNLRFDNWFKLAVLLQEIRANKRPSNPMAEQPKQSLIARQEQESQAGAAVSGS